MAKLVLIERDKAWSYPPRESFYSPGVFYPEYPWPESTMARNSNPVYDMVRECFCKMSYDAKHYGTNKWNPLGDVIKEGQTVLIKPNWVENKNSNKNVNDHLDCLVTNPSVVRAIVDYVAIALKKTGRIVIADAPMQQCNLSEVFRIAGYNELFDFYKRQGLEIEIADLRKYHVEEVAHHVYTETIPIENSEGVVVELGSASLHAEKDGQTPRYKVSEYELSNTASYHHHNKHTYEVNKLSLEADVIINVPKPKTHRLAGMTAACKNFVGITYEKACLPHRILGDAEHGGDAYKKKSFWKNVMQICEEKKTSSSINREYMKAKVWFFLQKVSYVLGYLTTGDKYRIGSWYGNDTIWRTAVDLNYLLLYADKNGHLNDTPQRKILSIGDMIIAGQGAGPVGPDPKPLGLIMIADNTLLFDRMMCEIMGFDYRKFPVFRHKKALAHLGYESFEQLNTESIFWKKWMKVEDFREKEEWHYNPHPCWKGYIEKQIPEK